MDTHKRQPQRMPAINVLRKVKVGDSWRLLPVLKEGDKHDLSKVVHAGSTLVAAEGTFHLEWREDGTRNRRAVGVHSRQVKDGLASQAKVVSLRKEGVQVDDAPQIKERRKITGPSVADVLERCKKRLP